VGKLLFDLVLERFSLAIGACAALTQPLSVMNLVSIFLWPGSSPVPGAISSEMGETGPKIETCPTGFVAGRRCQIVKPSELIVVWG
jgi:hypothetical protein